MLLTQNISNFELKIPDHAKYITNSEFNNLGGSTFDKKLKQASLGTNCDVNAVSQRANKNKEKIEKRLTWVIFLVIFFW